jgi:hypothetical protein
MLSSDRVKALSNYDLTFSPTKLPPEQSGSLLGYLNEKIKYLEIENNELKKEITMKSSDKEKTDYYMRIRKDLLEEIEKLKLEKINETVKLQNENDKLQAEVASLNMKINMQVNKSPNKEDLYKNSTTKKNSKFFPDFLEENKINTNNTLNEENFTSGLLSPKGKDLRETQNNIFFNTTAPMSEEYKDTTSLNGPLPISNLNSLTNHVNPFLPLIHDLEERIKLLEETCNQKDQEIARGEDRRILQKSEADSEVEKLQKEIEALKGKYINVLSSKKSLSQEYGESHEEQTETFKRHTEMTIFELEKKVLHLERSNENYEQDMEKLVKMNAESENIKRTEIENLKSINSHLISHYEQLYLSYEDNMKNLVKQIDSLKSLYIARENEFINITNYYTESIKDYSKPLASLTNPTPYGVVEDSFLRQSKENEDLRKKLEDFANEVAQLRMEAFDAKPKFRQTVSDSMRQYEEGMKNIIDNHQNLEAKLEKLNEYVSFFESKITFFAALLEDNRKLQEKISQLECEIKKSNIEGKQNENLELMEQNDKLQKELQIKKDLIKEYEEIIPKSGGKDVINISTSSKNKKGKEFAPEEVIWKLKSEIALITNQMTSLIKSKDSIEKFYQVKLKNLMTKVKEKNEKIEDLLNIIKKIENDFMGKKETVFNLWMLEFKEFKEKLMTYTEIQNLIQKFKTKGEELSLHKDRIYNEELYLLRQEVDTKDETFAQLKHNFELEKKTLSDLIDHYKNTIKSKSDAYDVIIEQKKDQIDSMNREKEKLEQIENSKKKVIQKF